jgi:hypothetical protein
MEWWFDDQKRTHQFISLSRVFWVNCNAKSCGFSHPFLPAIHCAMSLRQLCAGAFSYSWVLLLCGFISFSGFSL